MNHVFSLLKAKCHPLTDLVYVMIFGSGRKLHFYNCDTNFFFREILLIWKISMHKTKVHIGPLIDQEDLVT